jgi:DNA-binding CsgD family transcriptional regulator
MLIDFDSASTRLTPREREVLGLAANGYTSKEIGQQIGIAHRTVERHIENSRLKLAARNRAHLISKALKAGLLTEPGAGGQPPKQLSLDFTRLEKDLGA